MRLLFSAFPRAAALTCLLLGGVTVACADVTFDLNNVTLGNGNTTAGALTGSFVTNNSFTTLVSADLTASPSGTYIGETYTVANSTDNSVLPNFVQLNLNPVTNTSPELRLVFSSALTASGATLSTSSFEFEITGGERFVTSGSVSQLQPRQHTRACFRHADCQCHDNAHCAACQASQATPLDRTYSRPKSSSQARLSSQPFFPTRKPGTDTSAVC